MIFKQHFFYLCKTPLSAESPKSVEIITRAENSEDFSRVFKQFEELRSHAFNEDNLYNIVRADDIYELVRTGTEAEAKEIAFEKAQPDIVTNLQHRVMQKDDKNAKSILKEVHGLEA